MLKNVLVLLFLVSTPGHAAVVAYDNLNRDGGEINAGYGTWVGVSSGPIAYDRSTLIGSTFVPTVSGILDSFEVGVFDFDQLPSERPYTWSVHAADGVSSDLGEALWTQQYTQELAPTFETSTSFSADGDLMLVKGQEYWLILDVPLVEGTHVSWFRNNTGAIGDSRSRYHFIRPDFNEVRVNYEQDEIVYSMAVSVNPVPLPAAAWLFGSALLGLGAAKRRRA